eukprot:184975_1
MTLWALQWAKDNGIEGFKGSEEWWRKLLKRNKQKTKKPNTRRTHWRELGLYDDNNDLILNRMWNCDEVPIQFESKQKVKQVVDIDDDKDVALVRPEMTFDPSKRFGTLIPFVCADPTNSDEMRKVYPFVIMRGSPSQKEVNEYTSDVGWVCNNNAWSKGSAWTSGMVY